jgi:cytochrome subunit of sulfide dehydrogenase
MVKILKKHTALVLGLLVTWPVVSRAQFVANDARLLASNCFQCHGTNGKDGSFDSLAGESKKDALNELNEFRKKAANSNIMIPHARG